jgi:hypothetical protein
MTDWPYVILVALEKYFARGNIVCGKVPYSSQNAKRSLIYLRRKRRTQPERGTYKCGRCGSFHVTSHPK